MHSNRRRFLATSALAAAEEKEIMPLVETLGTYVPGRPWSMCVSVGDAGIHAIAEMPVALDGATAAAPLVVLSATSTLFVGARAWKKGPDRAAFIMNIRNCQQAMRGHQNMNNLKPGDPVTREMLEEYIKFSEDIQVSGGVIRFEPGDQITPIPANPPENGDHTWLKVTGPGIEDYVGEHGFSDLSETADW